MENSISTFILWLLVLRAEVTWCQRREKQGPNLNQRAHNRLIYALARPEVCVWLGTGWNLTVRSLNIYVFEYKCVRWFVLARWMSCKVAAGGQGECELESCSLMFQYESTQSGFKAKLLISWENIVGTPVWSHMVMFLDQNCIQGFLEHAQFKAQITALHHHNNALII